MVHLPVIPGKCTSYSWSKAYTQHDTAVLQSWCCFQDFIANGSSNATIITMALHLSFNEWRKRTQSSLESSIM